MNFDEKEGLMIQSYQCKLYEQKFSTNLQEFLSTADKSEILYKRTHH